MMEAGYQTCPFYGCGNWDLETWSDSHKVPWLVHLLILFQCFSLVKGCSSCSSCSLKQAGQRCRTVGPCHQSKPLMFGLTQDTAVWLQGMTSASGVGRVGCFLYWYSASVWVLISFSKGSICLLSNYVTNLHPDPLRILSVFYKGTGFQGYQKSRDWSLSLAFLQRSLSVAVLLFSSVYS